MPILRDGHIPVMGGYIGSAPVNCMLNYSVATDDEKIDNIGARPSLPWQSAQRRRNEYEE